MFLRSFIFYVYIILFLLFPKKSVGIPRSSTNTLKWTVSISDSPIISSPLLKSFGETYPGKFVATTLDGTVTSINVVSGKQEAPWPVHFTDKAFYAGPLMYDIDQDGSMEILLTSSDGEILFLAQNGTFLSSQTMSLPLLLVKRKWNIITVDSIVQNKMEPDTSPGSNTMFILLSEFEEKYQSNLSKFYVPVDIHVLSTPVIGDFDGDGIKNELIVPVNYYFEDDIKKDQQRLKSLSILSSEVDFYLANGFIVIDLPTQKIKYTIVLELTMKSSAFPAYLLSSPTVVDLDGKNGEAEVIIASMSGKIHIYNKAGKYFQNFEASDAIHGEVGVGDLNNDGKLEIVIIDGSGNVACYDDQKIIWEATVSGTMSPGAQLVDINSDDRLEVVIATNDGYLWVLEGRTGKNLPGWPIKLGEEIHSKVIFLTHLDRSVEIIYLADGKIHIFSPQNNLMQSFQTDSISYVPVVFHPQLKVFFLSTINGKIVCFKNHHEAVNITTVEPVGVRFVKGNNIVTTAKFIVNFEIYDSYNTKHNFYNVTIHFPKDKGIGYFANLYTAPGIYTVSLSAPQTPKNSYVSLELCNQFKLCTEDIAYFMFYPKTKDSLVIYLILPFLVMVSLLLILHGFPEGDLLPLWERTCHD